MFVSQFFGFFLNAWIFAGLIFIGFLFLIVTIQISRFFPRPKFERKSDEFENEYGYSHDYTFVFKVYQEDEIEELNEYQLNYTMKNIIDRCTNADLESKSFYSCQRDEIYLKIRASPARLLAEADRIDYKLELDPDQLRIAAATGFRDETENKWVWKPIKIKDDYHISKYDPYQYIYADYVSEPRLQGLYKARIIKDNEEKDKIIKQLLRPVDRIKLLISIFESNVNNTPPGCGLKLNQLRAKKVVLSHFPLHEYDTLLDIENKWLKLFSIHYKQPLLDIKDYFGEKLGLYFCFLEYYKVWIQIPALIGLFVYLWQVVLGQSHTFVLPVYAGGMSLWSTYLAESWKKHQATIAMKWGSKGYEDEESERVEFVGEETMSPIDGSPSVYYPVKKRFLKSAFKYFIIAIFVGICIAIVVCIAEFQNYLLQLNIKSQLFVIGNEDCSNYISSFVLVLLQYILSRFYWNIAILINDFENHRTETNYEDNLVITIFIFQFCNLYFYPTFVAFVKQLFSNYHCYNDDCLNELTQILLILTLIPVIIHCIEEVIVGKIIQALTFSHETSGTEPNVTVGIIERQYILAEYNVYEGCFRDYSAILMQFGYVSMFIPAFPNGPAIALFTTALRMRIDGWKLCNMFRRPLPKTAEDIGGWEFVMNLISIVSVLYNFAIIFFTSNYFDNTTWEFRWIYFIIVEHIAFTIKLYLVITIEDQSKDVTIQLARQDFLVSKVIHNEEDETEDTFDTKSSNRKIKISLVDEDYPIQQDQDEENEEEEKNEETKS